ncbi:MAG TPA: DsbA family protein [Candidatus Babeliaceae bacterium]|nr:DsbA family protein [Candidatus Babeliaceae bacterium]
MNKLKIPVTAEDHIQGDMNAPVTLLEYGDYECIYCGAAYYVIKQIQQHYGPHLRFVFRNFPLSEVHPHAEIAAEVAEFAGDYGRFWEMHDLLYENQDRLDMPLFIEAAQALGLSLPELERDISIQKHYPKIRNDVLGGIRSGVNGTPTFFINEIRHNGSYDYESLINAIEQFSYNPP